MERLLRESVEFRMIFEKSQNLLLGRYTSRVKGDGVEFIDLKEYVPGDDVRRIDWKVTARENKVFVKEFLEDKDSSHFILLDVSGSMKNKLFAAKVLAVSLLLASYRASDSFTVCLFNKQGVKILPLSKGKRSLMRYVYEVASASASEEGDLRGVILKLLGLVKKRAIVSVISDELDVGGEVRALLYAVRKRHKLNYFHLFSSTERNLEEGMSSFEDVETGLMEIYDLSEEEIIEYQKEFDRKIKFVEEMLIGIGVKPYVLDVDKDLGSQIKSVEGVI